VIRSRSSVRRSTIRVTASKAWFAVSATPAESSPTMHTSCIEAGGAAATLRAGRRAADLRPCNPPDRAGFFHKRAVVSRADMSSSEAFRTRERRSRSVLFPSPAPCGASPSLDTGLRLPHRVRKRRPGPRFRPGTRQKILGGPQEKRAAELVRNADGWLFPPNVV